MSYISEFINFERKINNLKPLSYNHAKYTGLDRLEKDIEAVAREITKSNLREHDKITFLDRIEGYKNPIHEYRNRINSTVKNDITKKEGIDLEELIYLLIYYFAGVVSGKAGLKLADFYKMCKNRRIEEITNYVFNKLVEETDYGDKDE